MCKKGEEKQQRKYKSTVSSVWIRFEFCFLLSEHLIHTGASLMCIGRQGQPREVS